VTSSMREEIAAPEASPRDSEVGPLLRLLDDGDWMVEITMVASGEKAEYRRSRAMDDPDAQ